MRKAWWVTAACVAAAILSGCASERGPETSGASSNQANAAGPDAPPSAPSSESAPATSLAILPGTDSICALTPEEVASAFSWSGLTPTSSSTSADGTPDKTECWYEHGDEATKYDQQVFSLLLTAEPYDTTVEQSYQSSCTAMQDAVSSRGVSQIGGCDDSGRVPVVFDQGLAVASLFFPSYRLEVSASGGVVDDPQVMASLHDVATLLVARL